MPKVRVKDGVSHRTLALRGKLAVTGDEIEVTEDELVSFGDKFDLLDPPNEIKETPAEEPVAKSKRAPSRKKAAVDG